MAVDTRTRRYEGLALADDFEVFAVGVVAHDNQFHGIELFGVEFPGEHFAAVGGGGYFDRRLYRHQRRIIDQRIALGEVADPH